MLSLLRESNIVDRRKFDLYSSRSCSISVFDEKLVSKPADLRNALKASVITEILRTWEQGQ